MVKSELANVRMLRQDSS